MSHSSQNLSAIKGLQPAAVWNIFAELSSIPRCSGHEQAAIEYVERFSTEHGLDYSKDAVGNVVVRKEPSPGFEKAPGVVLQGHLDMVCEKEHDSDHDFERDPIRMVVDGDWIRAEGTTLGADNGIAVALALAALSDPSLLHGPLEALFTVDEETGLSGATALSSGTITGGILINLDSEEEGVFFIGCAGGKLTIGSVQAHRRNAPSGEEYVPASIRISGLKGGHSGSEIHEQRGNAVSLIARILDILFRSTGIKLISVGGGSKHNAIPRECEARILLPVKETGTAQSIAEKYGRVFAEELAVSDPSLTVELKIHDSSTGTPPLEDSFARTLIRTLRIIPHGVMRMSESLPGLVETSSNLAAVITTADQVEILTSQRSSLDSGRDEASEKVRCALELLGAQVSTKSEYPAWTPDPDSPLLRLMQDTYREVTGEAAEARAIHAGLECAVIGDKFDGIRMISFGPDILDAHTPRERISISSTQRVWAFLRRALPVIEKS